MRKLYPNSRIEVWDTPYINHPEKRLEGDRNVEIVQIEAGSGEGSYIVEIVEKAEQEKTPDIGELARQIVDGNKEQKYPI